MLKAGNPRSPRSMRQRARSMIGCVLLALGCWNQAGGEGGQRAYNAFETTLDASTVALLDIAWEIDLGDDMTPLVGSNGRIYAASDGTATALAASNGEVAWTKPLGGEVGAPLLVGRWIWWPVRSGSTGTLHQLHAKTGDAIGTQEDDALYGPMVASGTWMVVRTTEFIFDFCNLGPDFALASGARIERLVGGATHLQNVDHLNIGELDGCIILVPEFPLPLAVFGSRLFVSRPVAGTVEARNIACDDRGDIISPPDGRCTRWSSEVDPISGPVVTPQQVAVASTAGLRVLDIDTGSLLFSGDREMVAVRPAAGPNHYVAITSGPTLVAYRLAGCGASVCPPAFQADLPAPLLGNDDPPGVQASHPSVTPELIFVGLSNGDVLAYPENGCGDAVCDPLWSTNVGSAVVGAPLPAGGMLFVATLDGRVSAFAPMAP